MLQVPWISTLTDHRTDRQTVRQGSSQKDRGTDRQQTDRRTDRQQTDRQTDRRTNRQQTDRQGSSQTDRGTGMDLVINPGINYSD